MSRPRGGHGRQEQGEHAEARGMERLEVGSDSELGVPFNLNVLAAHGAREGGPHGVQEELRGARYSLRSC